VSLQQLKWPASFRNGGRHQIGTVADIKSESVAGLRRISHRALERPDIPLHTNGSENDIRRHVEKRKVSGGTRSDAGLDSRDVFLRNFKTCFKNRMEFWNYLGAQLEVPESREIPDLVRVAAAALAPRPP